MEIESDIEGVEKLLQKHLPEGTAIPDIQAALVFSNPDIDIKAEDPPYPTLPTKKLKDLTRQEAKGKPISPELYKQIQDVIDPPEEDTVNESE